jgi:glycosyltransferase involved in cell wall biosynthesis
MHIGISTSVIQRGQTGIAQYLFALGRALIEQEKHEYTFFVLEEDLERFHFAAGKARLIIVPERFRPALKDILWHQTVLPGLAKRLRLDVLHVPSYRRMLGSRPCPLVATIHDLAQFHLRGKYNWPRMLYGRFIVPRLARRQDQIVAISENTSRDVIRFFKVPSERLTIIYNGVDHSRFFPGDIAQAKVLSARRFALAQPFFLYVARLEHPAKNHTRLIAAFNRCKAATGSTWQLVLAGGDWHGANHIHRAIQESPFTRDIRRLGFVPDAFLPDLYQAADAFVYPSLFEGFGMPPIEAMACGCPVISSARGALGEVIADAAICIDPEDVDAIAAQLCVLSAGTTIRNRIRAAGLARARCFDWATTAEATVRVYERAAGAAKVYQSGGLRYTRAPVAKEPVNTTLFSGNAQ